MKLTRKQSVTRAIHGSVCSASALALLHVTTTLASVEHLDNEHRPRSTLRCRSSGPSGPQGRLVNPCETFLAYRRSRA